MGKKKDAALAGLSPKKRRKLEERAAEVAAELARREKKAEKKHGMKKKGKAPKAGKKKGGNVTVFPDEAPVVVDPAPVENVTAPVDPEGFSGVESVVTYEAEKAEKKAKKHPHLEHLDEVARLLKIANGSTGAPKKVRKAAQSELDKYAAETAAREAETAETDAEIKARVQKKRADRAVAAADPSSVKLATAEDALENELEVDYQWRKKAEREQAETPTPVVEVVETEKGREFVAGAIGDPSVPESLRLPGEDPASEEFAKPSQATPELEEGRNGYKIMVLKDGVPDPKTIRQFTRMTTYVKNIDDDTMLGQWEKRLLAVGLAVDVTDPQREGEYTSKIADVTHRRDVKIAKAQKADRKGKLEIGALAGLVAAAEKEWRDAMNDIVDEALELAGRNDKADAGTFLHTLTEISDDPKRGIEEVRAMHGRDEISATDLASIEAYAARMSRLSAKVIHSESVVVNDALKVAGRLDRVIMAKLPELVLSKGTEHEWTRPADTRSKRYIMDVKSGRIDLGAGKIARQLTGYAISDLYNLETGERTKHGASRDVALVFHLPQGAGVCKVHAVDLKEGARELKLSGEIRAARNSGKKTIDTSVDIADAVPGGVVLETGTAAE